MQELVNKLKSITPTQHETPLWSPPPLSQFDLFDRADIRDRVDKYCPGRIIEVLDSDPKAVKVHFEGFDSKWDEVIKLDDAGKSRFAPFNSITFSSKATHQYKRSQLVDVHYRGTWTVGFVNAVDQSQVSVSFLFNNNVRSRWWYAYSDCITLHLTGTALEQQRQEERARRLEHVRQQEEQKRREGEEEQRRRQEEERKREEERRKVEEIRRQREEEGRREEERRRLQEEGQRKEEERRRLEEEEQARIAMERVRELVLAKKAKENLEKERKKNAKRLSDALARRRAEEEKKRRAALERARAIQLRQEDERKEQELKQQYQQQRAFIQATLAQMQDWANYVVSTSSSPVRPPTISTQINAPLHTIPPASVTARSSTSSLTSMSSISTMTTTTTTTTSTPLPECPICCDTIDERTVNNQPCGHSFCLRCIADWFKRSKEHECPLCRRKLIDPSSQALKRKATAQSGSPARFSQSSVAVKRVRPDPAPVVVPHPSLASSLPLPLSSSSSSSSSPSNPLALPASFSSSLSSLSSSPSPSFSSSSSSLIKPKKKKPAKASPSSTTSSSSSPKPLFTPPSRSRHSQRRIKLNPKYENDYVSA